MLYHLHNSQLLRQNDSQTHIAESAANWTSQGIRGSLTVSLQRFALNSISLQMDLRDEEQE